MFQNGSKWIDANLFNGEYYVQKIRGFKKDQIAASLRSTMGSEDTENPQYQVGEGCLVDQLLGQYLADVAGLGALVDDQHIQKTAASIYRYNYKRSMVDHDSVQRTFVLNDEAAIVICDYAKAQRPRIPFPYFAEAFTGSEYTAAVLMLYHGMEKEGAECIASIRARYDGEKRNPWDEAECGHHYARAMAAWSGILALSGFRYDGRTGGILLRPRVNMPNFRCFWSSGNGMGHVFCHFVGGAGASAQRKARVPRDRVSRNRQEGRRDPGWQECRAETLIPHGAGRIEFRRTAYHQ